MFDKKKYLLEKEVIGSSGFKLENYYDFIDALQDKDFINAIKLYILKKIPCNLIGIELFGAMVSYYLSGVFSEDDFRSAIILKERNHGARKRLYNKEKLVLKWRTLLIDDVITTGDTICEAMIILKENRIRVDRILCIKNRGYVKIIDGCKIYEIL
jgi:orotate phosphoribosyltransferase